MHKEPIHLLEVRAHIIGVCFQNGIQDWSGRGFLSLLDSMSDVLALETARVHDYRLLVQIRLSTGWGLFFNLHQYFC